MKPAPFAYHRPESRDEALDLLAEHADGAKVLAGGQSLVAAMNMRLARPARVVDINRIGEDTFAQDGDAFAVSALVRQSDLERSPAVRDAVPLLHEALPFVGHAQTRSRGTLCGSLAHADPSAELPVVATALGARMECGSRRGTRTVAADEFFVASFTTALEPDELLARALFPPRAARTGYAFAEFAERHGDYAIASAAAVLRLREDGAVDELRLVLGGVSDRPFVVDAHACAGRPLGGEAIETLAERAGRDIDPHSDLRGSAAYRRQLASVLSRRVLAAASLDARKEGS
ncbi:MAG: aerobic carbon-monoxide dehydrogenase medium subunit [Candidatus Eremiobacteraeota bacterium]|nr:aerobic carbon-monoxide dehydrogenase medium subunit [Candidatus Eremiobacteraeota bacterium]